MGRLPLPRFKNISPSLTTLCRFAPRRQILGMPLSAPYRIENMSIFGKLSEEGSVCPSVTKIQREIHFHKWQVGTVDRLMLRESLAPLIRSVGSVGVSGSS